MERSHRLRPRETRRCTGCGEVKPIMHFPHDRSLKNPEQRKYRCRECCSARRRQWFRELTDEQYRAQVRINVEKQARRRRQDREDSIATARTCIVALRRLGHSTGDICRMTGCRHETINRIERNETSRIQRLTVEKITGALRTEMARRADR